MSFYHSEEHDAFRETCERWVTRVVKPALQTFDLDAPLPAGQFDAFMQGIDRDGIATNLPRDEAGEPDWIAFGILLEETARASPSCAQFLVDTIGLSELPRRLMDDRQRAVFAESISGRAPLSGAFTEAASGSNQREMKTLATRRGGEWIISGRKIWISGATHSNALILACKTRQEGEPDGFGLFFVERRCGWEASAIPMLGLNWHPTCEVVFDNVVVPQIAQLAPDTNVFRLVQDMLFNGRCFMSAMSVGIAQAAYDASLAYALQREQFGRKIAGFQLIQSMLVDMATDIECGKLLTYKTYDALARGTVDATQASMAKMFCTEMCVRVASLAVQIHGALGLARDTGIERIFRDARMMTIPDGTTQIQKLIIGRELTGISALHG